MLETVQTETPLLHENQLTATRFQDAEDRVGEASVRNQCPAEFGTEEEQSSLQCSVESRGTVGGQKCVIKWRTRAIDSLLPVKF